jgi:transposase-like protein
MNMDTVFCKYCNSLNTIKFGTFSGIQRYYCKDCLRKAVRKSVAKKRKAEPKPSASIQTGKLK